MVNELELRRKAKESALHLKKKPFLSSRKAQIKIQEMAFVMLAIVLLAVIALIFFMRVSSEKIKSEGEFAKQQTAISLLDKIASLTELSCAQGTGTICIDEKKAEIVSSDDYQARMKNIFQGINETRIRRIYPSGDDIVVYKAGKVSQSYSTFISLCKQEKVGYSMEWKCGIALLELGY